MTSFKLPNLQDHFLGRTGHCMGKEERKHSVQRKKGEWAHNFKFMVSAQPNDARNIKG